MVTSKERGISQLKFNVKRASSVRSTLTIVLLFMMIITTQSVLAFNMNNNVRTSLLFLLILAEGTGVEMCVH